MNRRRLNLTRGALAALVTLFASVALAGPAHAAIGHNLFRQIGNTGTGTLSGVGDLVARPAQGDVFVVDTNASRVRRYTLSGNPGVSIDTSAQVASPSLIAYDPSSQNLYVAGEDSLGVAVLARYDIATGASVPTVDLAGAGITSVSGIAVDSTGRLYVGDTTSDPTLRAFTSSGAPDGTFDGSANGGAKFESLGPLAVDTDDDVYVVEPYARTRKFSAGGAQPEGLVGPDRPLDLAIDPSNDELYILDSPDGARFGITHYSAGGQRLARFEESTGAASFTGLAVGDTNRTLLVGNPAGPAVDVYGTTTAPDVTTDTPPTRIDTVSADVTGAVNPLGTDTTYAFDYGTDSNYGSSTSEDTISDNGSVDVDGALTDLRPNTLYHYRLRAFNDDGPNLGEDRTFTTAAAPPGVAGESATAITPTSATLNATVNGFNRQFSVYFEYGTDTTYGTPTPLLEDQGGSDFDTPFSVDLTDLQPDTVYHYRVVADNGVGNGTRSPDRTFRTARALPLAAGARATLVSGDTVALSGSVDTQGLPGEAAFLVQARNSTYSTLTPAITLPEGRGSRPVSATLSGLPTGGTFDVRVRIRTTTGTVFSDPVRLSTPFVAAPPVPAPLAFDAFPYPPLVAPSNRFTASASVKSSTGTIKVKVPGRGVVTATGKRLSKATSRPSRAGTVSLKVKLTKSGRAALRRAKSKRLRIKVAVRYRPTDGTTRTGYRTLTFRR